MRCARCCSEVAADLRNVGAARVLSSFGFSGGSGEGETPVPIPNTAVKPLSADGTACASVWESRSLPGNIFWRPSSDRGLFVYRLAVEEPRGTEVSPLPPSRSVVMVELPTFWLARP